MRLHQKLLLSFMGVLAIFCLISIVVFINASKVQKNNKDFLATERIIMRITTLRAAIRNQIVITYENVFLDGANDMDGAREKVIDLFNALDSILPIEGPLCSHHTGDDSKRIWKKIRGRHAAFSAGMMKAVSTYVAGDRLAGKNELTTTTRTLFYGDILKRISAELTWYQTQSLAQSIALGTAIRDLKIFIWCGLASATLLILIMIVYWSYTFRRRLALLQAAAVRIGRGDFSIPVATKGSDELSALGDSFNGMMTQLSAAQDALVQSKAKIEMKNREILDLTNVVVHDLKKPLTVMKTVCSLFKIGSCGTLNDEGKEAMAIGSQTLSYMEEMLGDLLENARLEAGANTLEFEEFDLNGLITDVLSRLRYIAEEKGVQITIQPGIGIVKADKKSVAKVYMNLIGNALNYLSPGPDKKIAVGTADVDGQKAFFVRDNGIGIPVDTQKTLFQKFKRGSNVGEISGTGLGLSIVRGIVGAHGGKVWAESRVNEGTTFYFTLSRR